ncbi:hypothetical protein GLX_21520 [Komagataeibacter medellinensis NBRC 3288]|uniref:Uncharacterized protein n=1 Tax=Komagataeibacter medellinensis (strain NBRC 3288 / BCRC 11682 / LMG 1693 / Kondo 51) TaxID=634177 RepID=G2I0V6_KOMMN|nr:hypothetical protein GLX_21520 [Komagataeibacter medellinensis NBRC 3288]
MQGPVISSAVIKELEGGFKIFDDRNGSLPGGASIDEEITAQLSMALKLMIKNINDFPLDHYDSETRSPDQTGK